MKMPIPNSKRKMSKKRLEVSKRKRKKNYNNGTT